MAYGFNNWPTGSGTAMNWGGMPSSNGLADLSNLPLGMSIPTTSGGSGSMFDPPASNTGGLANIVPETQQAVAGAATPTGGFMSSIGGLQGLGTIAQGLASLGQIFTAMQGVKLAREQLSFQKDAFNTNMRNQTQSYNTALNDRIRARAAAEGQTSAQVDSYLKKHSL